MEPISIIVALIGLFLGAIITFVFIKKTNEGKAASIIKDAEAKAEVVKTDKILQAKEKFFQLKGEHEKLINEKWLNPYLIIFFSTLLFSFLHSRK